MRFGQAERKAEQGRKRKEKNKRSRYTEKKQKDTSKTHPGESTGQFCEHHTLSEVICLEKDDFGWQFREFALSNL